MPHFHSFNLIENHHHLQQYSDLLNLCQNLLQLFFFLQLIIFLLLLNRSLIFSIHANLIITQFLTQYHLSLNVISPVFKS